MMMMKTNVVKDWPACRSWAGCCRLCSSAPGRSGPARCGWGGSSWWSWWWLRWWGCSWWWLRWWGWSWWWWRWCGGWGCAKIICLDNLAMLPKICRHHVLYLQLCTFWLGESQYKYLHQTNSSFTRLTKIHASGSSTWKAKVPSESVLAILQNVWTLSIYPLKFSRGTRSTHCHQNSFWLTVITIVIAKSVRQQLTLAKVKSKIFKLNTSSGRELIILRNLSF